MVKPAHEQTNRISLSHRRYPVAVRRHKCERADQHHHNDGPSNRNAGHEHHDHDGRECRAQLEHNHDHVAGLDHDDHGGHDDHDDGPSRRAELQHNDDHGAERHDDGPNCGEHDDHDHDGPDPDVSFLDDDHHHPAQLRGSEGEQSGDSKRDTGYYKRRRPRGGRADRPATNFRTAQPERRADAGVGQHAHRAFWRQGEERDRPQRAEGAPADFN